MDAPTSVQGALPKGTVLNVVVGPQFEECLDISWSTDPTHAATCMDDFEIEMVLDRGGRRRKDEKLAPAPDAMVKRVGIGTDKNACIQNMPSGRHFLVTVVGKLRGKVQVRGNWAQASTLHPQTHKSEICSLDPLGGVRRNCKFCSCAAYVALAWNANSFQKSRCRKCGCEYTCHVLVEAQEILDKRTKQAQRSLQREALVELPPEAVDWDERECLLWCGTDGRFHPRKPAARPAGPGEADAQTQRPAGGYGSQGRAGCVSVVTPTTEARQHFHQQLWGCFLAQTWKDKELVVVETYVHKSSKFLEEVAKKDPRLVYLKFQCKQGQDWSIGMKRNICAHVASGELLANFDDDDLYSPSYLSTMVSAMEEQSAQAITLSSWYVFHAQAREWRFCHPIAWGLTKGHDESDEEVRTWAYGYGFSYVFRRQAGLEFYYEDINFGEDYAFMCQLQRRKGARSVALFHDDFGICAHIQHGGNTSDSIPLRVVPQEEALDLAVTELRGHLEGGQLAAGLEALAVSLDAPPRERRRSVAARFCSGDWGTNRAFPECVVVECAVGATVAEFLQSLERELGSSCEGARVCRAPPLDVPASAEDPTPVSEAQRDEIAAKVLGIAFLADLPEARDHLDPETKSGRQWRKLLETAKCPLESWSRIDLRTKQLWLLPPETASADGAELSNSAEHEAFIIVQGARLKTSAKALRGISSFQVRLPVGAPVSLLRFVLSRSLPPAAKVLADGPKGDSITLKETDPVPESITVTDFKGQRSYFVHLSENQVWEAMLMIRAFLRKPDNQRKVRDIEAEAGANRFAYSLLLTRMYVQEAYPGIARRFGFPGDVLDSETFPHLVGPHLRSSLDMSFLWLEVEVLGRQWTGAKDGLDHVNHFLAERGLPAVCSWEEFITAIDPIDKDRVEAMDYLRTSLKDLLYPL